MSNRRRPHQVRIIAGQWKRAPLSVATVDGLRPTPDRVRETVFNWLEHLQLRRWDNRRCLDLFAGTGALGFEAASRGAAEVIMVESHPTAMKNLRAERDKLQAQQVILRQGDAAHLLTTLPGLFDLIFLDPPYRQRQLPDLLPACLQRLSPNGLLYLESDQAFAPGNAAADSRRGSRDVTDQIDQPVFVSQILSSSALDAAQRKADFCSPEWLAGWEVVRSDKAGQVHFALLRPQVP